MAIDTPARIAIIGAGPIGIEATLYARFLGYDVDLYERGEIAEHVRRWGGVRMFTPWQENVSPLGVAALSGQIEGWQAPPGDTLLTAREMIERYWLPLAESDLVVDSLRRGTEVLSVSRQRFLKHEMLHDPARGDDDFVLLTRDAQGHESLATAEVVIDCTGVQGNHRWAGQGGGPALGERSATIEYGIPNWSDDSPEGPRHSYAGRPVLVIGAGHSAATNVVQLAALDPRPNVTWITRRELLASATGPIDRVPHDPFPERDRVAQLANDLTTAADSSVTHYQGTSLASITWDNAQRLYRCQLVGEHAEVVEVARIIANVGHRADGTLYEPLQVDNCPATGAVRQLDKFPILSEPDFYILGSKSAGSDSNFLLSEGREQIRRLFAIIGDREGLDLYRTIKL